MIQILFNKISSCLIQYINLLSGISLQHAFKSISLREDLSTYMTDEKHEEIP